MNEDQLDLFLRDCGVVKELYVEWNGDIVSWSRDHVHVNNNMFIQLAKGETITGIEFDGELHLKMVKNGLNFVTVIK